MLMNWADWVIVGIIIASSLFSIKRGFVKEAISLAVWLLAFFVAVAFHERLAIVLQDSVESASLRHMIAYGALFTATFVVGSMVNYLVGELVRMTGLSGTDRLFGMAFGLTRGVVIIMTILIFLPMSMPVEEDKWWQEASLIPQFLLMEQWCKDTFSSLLDWVSSMITIAKNW